MMTRNSEGCQPCDVAEENRRFKGPWGRLAPGKCGVGKVVLAMGGVRGRCGARRAPFYATLAEAN